MIYGSALNCRTPSIVGVVFRKRCGGFSCPFAQVFLVDDTVLSDNERHDPRIPVLRRVGQRRKSTGHSPIHYVILGTAWRLVTLLGEDPEVVAVVRLWFIAGVRVTC